MLALSYMCDDDVVLMHAGASDSDQEMASPHRRNVAGSCSSNRSVSAAEDSSRCRLQAGPRSLERPSLDRHSKKRQR